MSFQVGDKCVVPALGVGVIRDIKGLNLEGTTYQVYEIKILDNGATYTTPVDQADANGIREVIPQTAVDRVYEILRDRDTPTDKQTWNRRYREYMEKIKTGSVFEIAEVLRDLYLLKGDKDLSFGERKMLDTARSLLIKELSLAKGCTEDEIEADLKKIFNIPA